MVLGGQGQIVMSAFFTLVASMELVKNLGNATATEDGVDSSATRYFICHLLINKQSLVDRVKSFPEKSFMRILKFA